jgi:transcriptional regulator with XRE-family HTH domain
MPSDKSNDEKIVSRAFGQRLREIRKDRGFRGLKEFADLLGNKYCFSAISRREAGGLKIDFEYLNDFCAALKLTPEETDALMTSARIHVIQPKSRLVESVSEWSRITLNAKVHQIYTVDIFDYYLRTFAYACTLLRLHNFAGDVENSARLRVENAASSLKDPLKSFRIICHENALYMPIGSIDVMLEQLKLLLDFQDEPNVEFRILPRGSVLSVPIDLAFDIVDNTYCICENRLDLSIADDPVTIARFQSDFDTIWNNSVIGIRRNQVLQNAIEYYKKRREAFPIAEPFDPFGGLKAAERAGKFGRNLGVKSVRKIIRGGKRSR